MLLTVFVSPDPPHTTNINTIKTRLEALNLGPVTKGDLYNLLINPFMERQNILLEYMKTEGEGKGLSSKEVRGVLEEVAGRCLEIECKVRSAFLFTFSLEDIVDLTTPAG